MHQFQFLKDERVTFMCTVVALFPPSLLNRHLRQFKYENAFRLEACRSYLAFSFRFCSGGCSDQRKPFLRGHAQTRHVFADHLLMSIPVVKPLEKRKPQRLESICASFRLLSFTLLKALWHDLDVLKIAIHTASGSTCWSLVELTRPV